MSAVAGRRSASAVLAGVVLAGGLAAGGGTAWADSPVYEEGEVIGGLSVEGGSVDRMIDDPLENVLLPALDLPLFVGWATLVTLGSVELPVMGDLG